MAKRLTYVERPQPVIVVRRSVLLHHLKNIAKETIDYGSLLRNLLSGLLVFGLGLRALTEFRSTYVGTKASFDIQELFLAIGGLTTGTIIILIVGLGTLRTFTSKYGTPERALTQIESECENH
jgi:hypothetical protein